MVFPSTLEVGTNGECRMAEFASMQAEAVILLSVLMRVVTQIIPLVPFSLQLYQEMSPFQKSQLRKIPNLLSRVGEAEFTLTTSSFTRLQNIDVNVIFDVEDDFIATSETNKSKTVAFTSAGSTTTPVTFATKVNASSSTSDGSISATLAPGAGYSLATACGGTEQHPL